MAACPMELAVQVCSRLEVIRRADIGRARAWSPPASSGR